MRWARFTFECSHCGAVLPDSEGLKAHAARHRDHPDEGALRAHAPSPLTFACSHCEAAFSNRWGLRAHLLEHGVVVPMEWGRSPGVKRRVVAIPSELSRRHRAVCPDETPPAVALAGSRPVRKSVVKRFALAAAALLIILILTSPAAAWWTTSASISAKATAGTWGNYLSFARGTSQATHFSASGCPRSALIASLDKQGNLALDFGDALPGVSSSWSDVFRVTSAAPAPLKVSFTASGALAPFIAAVGFVADKTGGVLSSKQTRNVAVQLVVPKTAAPGTYTGKLTVAVAGGESHAIAMTVRTLGKAPSPSPSCSPSPSPSCSPSSSPSCSGSPSPTPSAVQLFGLAPGLSRVLPGTGTPSPPPTVAGVQADGTIKLDFGHVPQAKDTTYSDVVRMASQTTSTATVSLAVSGPVAKLVEGVGFWEGAGVVCSGLTLKAGQTQRLAFRFCPSSRAVLGDQQGMLTITASFANGRSQQIRVPVALDLVSASADSSPSPKCSPTSSTTPRPKPSPSAKGSSSPSPGASASVSPKPSGSPNISPKPSGSPTVSSPSASPSPSLAFWQGSIWLAVARLSFPQIAHFCR